MTSTGCFFTILFAVILTHTAIGFGIVGICIVAANLSAMARLVTIFNLAGWNSNTTRCRVRSLGTASTAHFIPEDIVFSEIKEAFRFRGSLL